MAERSSPTVRRRELGQRLRELRTNLDLTLEQVAARMLVSPTKISRIESGARGVSLRDVRDLSEAYGVSDEEREQLMALTRQSRERAWWQEYDLPYQNYVGLEQVASSISEFNPSIVPGLLQTEEYAVALMDGMEIDEDRAALRRQIEARIARQAILTAVDAPQFWAVVDEAVLRRVVGNARVMAEQLRHVLVQAALPNVHVQVMPFEHGSYPGQNNTFILLELDENHLSDVVYVEGLLGFFYLERSTDLRRYRRVLDRLRSDALSGRRSVALIEDAAASFEARATT